MGGRRRLGGMTMGTGAPLAPELPPGFSLDAPTAQAPQVAAETQPATTEAAPEPADKTDGVEMFDPSSGHAVTVDPSKAKEAFQAGQLGWAPGQTLHVKDERGKVFEIKPEQADQAFGAGYSVASRREVDKAIEAKKYGTLGSAFEAGAIGVGRGLTLGLSDPLAIGAAGAIGGDESAKATREHLRALKEHNPVASMGGEIVGALAPVVLSAGSAAGAEGGIAAAEGAGAAAGAAGEGLGVGGRIAQGVRTMGALPRGVAHVGDLVGEGASHLVGEGATGLLGRVAQKAIPMAAQGATEGALYGMGSEVSESALGDSELNAEKLLAAAKHGAVFGALTGGAIGAGEVLGKSAVQGAMKLAGKESVEDFFRSFAQERTVKALGGDAAAMRRLGEDRSRKIADTVLDYHFENGEKLFKTGATVDELGERVTKAIDEQTSRLDGIRKKVSGITEQSAELAPDVKGMLEKIDNDVLAPLKNSDVASVRSKANKIEKELETLRGKSTPAGIPEGHPLYEVAQNRPDLLELAAQKDPSVAALMKPTPVSIDELTKFRQDLDSVLYPKVKVGVPPPAPEHAAELLQMRRMVEDEIESATEKAAKASGDEGIYKDFLDAKDKIHSLIPAKQMAEKAAINKVGNRFFSLSDTLYSAGAGSGLMAGGGLASAAAIPGGLATAALHKLVRERGSSFAAAAADRIANFAAIQRATDAVDKKISVGIKDFLSHSGREALSLATEGEAVERGQERIEKGAGAAAGFFGGKKGQTRTDVFDAKRSHVAEMAANPQRHLDHIQATVQDIAVHAPQTATALSQKASAAMANVSSRLPQPAARPGSVQPALDKTRISGSDMARFARYAAAVDKPLSIFDDMRAGRLSRDTVEAVKQNYPKLFSEIQTQLQEQIATQKSRIPYEKRIQLGILFGIPTDASLEPNFKRSILQTYAEAGQPQTQQQPKGRVPGARRPMKITPGQNLLPSQSLGME